MLPWTLSIKEQTRKALSGHLQAVHMQMMGRTRHPWKPSMHPGKNSITFTVQLGLGGGGGGVWRKHIYWFLMMPMWHMIIIKSCKNYKNMVKWKNPHNHSIKKQLHVYPSGIHGGSWVSEGDGVREDTVSHSWSSPRTADVGHSGAVHWCQVPEASQLILPPI